MPWITIRLESPPLPRPIPKWPIRGRADQIVYQARVLVARDVLDPGSRIQIVTVIRVAHAGPATAGLHLRELLLYLHMTTRRRTRTCVY